MKIARLAASLLVCLALACGGSSDGPTPPDAAADSSHDHSEHERPRGRPLPAFSGFTLDGAKLDITEVIGQRFLLLIFNPDAEDAGKIVRAANAIAPLRGDHNFQIVGVATGSERSRAQSWIRDQGVAFDVIDDSSARLSGMFGLRGPNAAIVVDSEGFITFGIADFGKADDAAVEELLRESLRLSKPSLSARPLAPVFSAPVLDGDARFDLAAHRGEPVLLIFFLHTCPHCHSALTYLKQVLGELPEEKRPTLVGLEITGKQYAVRASLRELDLEYFPVIFDEDGSITQSYGVFGAVPDLFFIDREGRIVARNQGWVPDADEPVVRMRTAKLAGGPVPMMLNTAGYSGSEICGVCHEAEHETWTFTSHASAYDTLVKHGADHDGECVSCHVVGYDEPGGFRSPQTTPGLEDVGCESCHGRGGPHLSPEFVKGGSYEAACVTCHDPKHSIGFEYASFLPRISHAANAALLSLPPEEKQRILAERGRPGGALLPTDVASVGSEACASCHATEFEIWSSSPHAESTAAGGVNAGCESCHGPGGNHVPEDATKLGSILALGDKCDSCAIVQICGSCHDDASDPGFHFEIQEKIDAQRHGTIEPGTGKPKRPDERFEARLLERARELAG